MSNIKNEIEPTFTLVDSIDSVDQGEVFSDTKYARREYEYRTGRLIEDGWMCIVHKWSSDSCDHSGEGSVLDVCAFNHDSDDDGRCYYDEIVEILGSMSMRYVKTWFSDGPDLMIQDRETRIWIRAEDFQAVKMAWDEITPPTDIQTLSVEEKRRIALSHPWPNIDRIMRKLRVDGTTFQGWFPESRDSDIRARLERYRVGDEEDAEYEEEMRLKKAA